MANCSECNTRLAKNAKFCHNCGTKVTAPTANCWNCNTVNPNDAKFCITCGSDLKNAKKKNKKVIDEPAYEPAYPVVFDSRKTLSEQIKTHFFQALKNRVGLQSNPGKYSDYLEAFYSSGFNYFFDSRVNHITQLVSKHRHLVPSKATVQIDHTLDDAFEGLLDRFTIGHTAHLNEVQLSPAILQYENVSKNDVNIEQMIIDFIDVEKEKNREKIYMDFMNMPMSKLKNASKSFLFPASDEPIYLIADQSVFRNGKEGFAFTARAMYWRAHFNKAQKVHYHEIYEVKSVDDWITINGKYFFVNKSLNFKVAKLLKKLRALS